jgi:hypothetical protein
MKVMRPKIVALLLSAFAAVAASPVAAELRHHKTVFDVRFGALTVGSATFDIRFDDKSYSIEARGRTEGVVDVFAPGKGVATSAGAIDKSQVVASRHHVEYKEKKKTETLEMAFAGGAVEKVKFTPEKPARKKGRKWVPIEPEQLKHVVDPASTIVVPVQPGEANDPKAVCNRTFNVYDGTTRYDIVLKYKATRKIRTDGYDGYAFVCRLRYVPVSGHKRGQKNVEYMAANEDIEIWLAPMSAMPFYSPVRIEVPTWIGTVSAMPSYFGNAKD